MPLAPFRVPLGRGSRVPLGRAVATLSTMRQKKLIKLKNLHYKQDYITKFQEHEQTGKIIEKVVITGNIYKNKNNKLENYIELGKILRKTTGQTGKLIKARKSIAGFNVMEGEIIGIQTTLRNQKMLSFLEILYFMVQVGDRGIRPKITTKGQIQCGLPLMFNSIKNENKEKYGWNIGIQLTCPTVQKKSATVQLINSPVPAAQDICPESIRINKNLFCGTYNILPLYHPSLN